MTRSAVVFAILMGSVVGCARAPASASTPPAAAAPEPVAHVEAEPEPEPEPETLEIPAGATVVVMEAEDLGGGAHAVVATPKRPELGSMLSGIGMAPSH